MRNNIKIAKDSAAILILSRAAHSNVTNTQTRKQFRERPLFPAIKPRGSVSLSMEMSQKDARAGPKTGSGPKSRSRPIEREFMIFGDFVSFHVKQRLIAFNRVTSCFSCDTIPFEIRAAPRPTV